ncbi:TPM domain-containing protein [Novosphingobium mangrovi (ex Huang et al. 2023)]|uniref:TPM domain-containing protein n=1 Tax=Novosphingobium mangrovi (ex Huang et al. 2023) TaxID=2976432 RepID=UPI003AF32609
MRFRALFAPFLLLLCALLAGPQAAWAAPDFPKLTGQVVDAAGIIPKAEQAQLTQKLAALEKQSTRQMVVVTVPSLQGYEISDYGYQLGREWGIGQKGKDNGVLLLVAPKERKVRIEVGYGLEPIMTDGMSFLIINKVIIPYFKKDDYPGGIAAGTDAIIKQITLPPEEAQKIAAQADQQRQGSGGGISLGTVVFILVILFFVVMPMINEARSGGRRRRSGGGFIWIPGGFGGNDDHWGGGGGWGGGGFGGGGFSGGGGSFGGGGASGSW